MVAAGVGRAVCIKGLRISVLIELPYSPEKKLGTYCTETAEDIDKLVRPLSFSGYCLISARFTANPEA
jgi:hypothetical protein